MSIFLLVIALLVVAILLSRMTWWPVWGERRSVKQHDRAMDVLRSMSSRRTGSETVASLAARDPVSSTSTASAQAALLPEESVPHEPVPVESSWQPHENVRLLGEPSRWSALSPAAASPTAPPAVSGEPAAAAETGDAGGTGQEEGAETVRPSFVFFADGGSAEGAGTIPPLPSPPSLEDVAGASPSRHQALLLFVSRTMDRPRFGMAVGLVMVVVMATMLGTVLAITSSSSGRSQRVRQVTAPPTTSAPAPAPATTPPPVATDVPPSTAVPATAPATTTPTTSVATPIRSSTILTSPPPTTTTTPPTTSPPTTSTPASVVSSTPSTTSPPTTTTSSTTSTTSPTTTTTTKP